MSRMLSLLSLFAFISAVLASVSDADVESRRERFWAAAAGTGDSVGKHSKGGHDHRKHEDKHKKQKGDHRKHKDDGRGEESVCHRWDWRKNSLKLLVEMPAAGLFADLKGHDKFEISSITKFNDEYVMVFDSLMELGFTDDRLLYKGENNYLAGSPGNDSEYEAIVSRPRLGTLIAIKEAHESNSGNWHPIAYELQVQPDRSVKIVSECPLDYALRDGDKKGIEGAAYIDKGDDGEFLLALCEGNYCEGNKARGREIGNGRLILTQLQANETGCVWATQRVLHIPKSAAFKDYSDIDILGQGTKQHIVISSQEDAAIWIGHFNTETFEFEEEGTVLHFPRMGSGCEVQYCNIEGVQFIDDTRIITTTDRAKKDQPWGCSAKDQSVQVFALPAGSKV